MFVNGSFPCRKIVQVSEHKNLNTIAHRTTTIQAMTLNRKQNTEDSWVPTPYVKVPTKDDEDDTKTQITEDLEEENEDTKTECMEEVKENNKPDIGKWLLIGGATVGGVALIPIALGFGAAGIVGGSIAAGMQSAIGNVAAGSAFAIAQSLGAQGVFVSAASAGGVTALTGAALSVGAGNNSEANKEEGDGAKEGEDSKATDEDGEKEEDGKEKGNADGAKHE